MIHTIKRISYFNDEQVKALFAEQGLCLAYSYKIMRNRYCIGNFPEADYR